MTEKEMKSVAKAFAAYWKDKGDEKSDTQSFWLSLLHDVYGVEEPTKYVSFEKRVKDTTTNFIDVYIPSTRVMIEQKTLGKNLRKGIIQSDGSMRTVCGRLEMRYRYASDIVYNNFPWCNPIDAQKAKIEKTAQMILDARAKYPDCSLADLYDEAVMPPELRKAHQLNDRAVMEAYGFWGKLNTESECVAELMGIYRELTTNEKK